MSDKSEHDYIQWVLKTIVQTNEMMGQLNQALIGILTTANQNLITTVEDLNEKINSLDRDLYWEKMKTARLEKEAKAISDNPLPAEPF